MQKREPREQKGQRARFIETARALGAEEDETAFKAKLGVIARQKPKDDVMNTAASKSLAEQLADAKAELAAWHEQFENYNGNNPKKYQTDIRRAADRVRRLQAEIDGKS